MDDKEPVLDETLDNEPEQTETDTDEVNADETPEESARLAIEELQKAGGDGEESAPEEEKTEALPASQDPTKLNSKPDSKKSSEPEPNFDRELEPPERLTPEEKAIFKRSSPAMKRVLHRVVKSLESGHSKALSADRAELSQKTQKYRDLDAILDPYRPELIARGHNEVSAISELLKIHKGLSDPQTRFKTYEDLGRQIGYTGNVGNTSTDGATDISTHPHVKQLEEKINQLQKAVEPIHNNFRQAHESQAQQVNEGLRRNYVAVAEELDNQGRLLYPKLSQESSYFDKVRPLVVALMQSDPDLMFQEALKEAYNRTEKRNGYLHQNQARPSPRTNNNNRTTPPLSVRGKTTSVSDLSSYDDEEINPNETPEQSARIAIERLQRGVH